MGRSHPAGTDLQRVFGAAADPLWMFVLPAADVEGFLRRKVMWWLRALKLYVNATSSNDDPQVNGDS